MRVQTVLGEVAPDELGVVLPHEHCFADLSVRFAEPAESTQKQWAVQSVNLESLWYLKYHPLSSRDNLRLWDEELLAEEVTRFKIAGGGTIVDMSSIGLGRDPSALARLSRRTGVNIVMGSGYYVDDSVRENQLEAHVDAIADGIARDVLEGVLPTGIRAGVIGEIGCSWPLREKESKSLQAAAKAQRLTGAAIDVHPGYSPDAPFDALRILEDAGADLTRVNMSHVDMRLFSHEERVRLAKKGCYLSFDLFGADGYPWTRMVVSEATCQQANMPTDDSRIDSILALIDDGFLNQLLISQDICFKTRLCRYGGHGYAHILLNVVPLMLQRGLNREMVRTITVDNPRRMLQFA